MKEQIGFTANQQTVAASTNTAATSTTTTTPVAPAAITTATTKVDPKLKEQLTRQLMLQTTAFHIGPQSDEKYAEKAVNMVVGKNGVFRIVSTPVADFVSQLMEGVTRGTGTAALKETIVGLPEVQAGVHLKVPKIPWKYWLMALAFYRDVHKKDKTEASLLFFWNHNSQKLPTHYGASEDEKKKAEAEGRTPQGAPIHGLVEDGQLVIYVPKQKNSASLSKFDIDPMVDYLRQNLTPLCETHSH